MKKPMGRCCMCQGIFPLEANDHVVPHKRGGKSCEGAGTHPMEYDPPPVQRCLHKKAWIIGGGQWRWCPQCGAIKGNTSHYRWTRPNKESPAWRVS